MSDLVNIKSTKNENDLKKETGTAFSESTNNFDLRNFDFTKKIFFILKKL